MPRNDEAPAIGLPGERWPSDPDKLERFLLGRMETVRLEAQERAKPYFDALVRLHNTRPPARIFVREQS